MTNIKQYNSFISVVGVLHSEQDLVHLPEYLSNVHKTLSTYFTDYEIILINNHFSAQIPKLIAPLPPEIKRDIFLLNLSATTNKNHAIVAGLDRSNGDYTVIFELAFWNQSELIPELFQKTQEHNDIVYLRAKERSVKLRFRPLYNLFYYILKRYSQLSIDEKAHNTRIISRRALNSLLRLRENLRYMKAVYSIVGYNTSSIEVDEPIRRDASESFSDQFRTSLVAITSYTTFLRTLLLWIFLFSFVFLFGVIINALKVKFTGVDLFGNVSQAFSGWTFLVILISVFFATTCLNLYIMSIYLSNIYQEIKQRPLYILESIQRF